ncbi:MAG: DUF1552 domain-containing protein [Myxococcales bacterium]|nr:DUF1552 domain-containing protein [Myxococcales bacterium]
MIRITRRGLLQAAGLGAGAALLSPFLRSIGRSQSSIPRRFVIVVEGNCSEPIVFLSDAARARVEAESTGDLSGKRWYSRSYSHDSPILIEGAGLGSASALDGLVGSGGELDLQALSSVVYGLSSKVAGGGHTTHHGALSCTRSTQNSPGGPTIDQWLSLQPQVRGSTPFDVLRLGITARSSALVYETCAFATGQPAPIICDPSIAFNAVFGSVAQGAGQATFRERGELLDFAHADVQAALQAFSGSSDERAKLEQYLASIEQITQRQEQLEDMGDTLAAVAPEDPSTNALYASGHPLDALRAQFDIATASLLGGLTNVVVLASGTGSGFDVQYSSLIDTVGRHDLHHESSGNPEYLSVIHEVSRQHVLMIAKMARTLAATPEVGADGTMLDHTAILYISDNGEQHHSNAEEWPALIVGGSALGFQHGDRTVVYPGHGHDNNRQLSNLFNTLGFAAGEELLDFGAEGSSRIAEGELSEVWSPA